MEENCWKLYFMFNFYESCVLTTIRTCNPGFAVRACAGDCAIEPSKLKTTIITNYPIFHTHFYLELWWECEQLIHVREINKEGVQYRGPNGTASKPNKDIKAPDRHSGHQHLLIFNMLGPMFISRFFPKTISEWNAPWHLSYSPAEHSVDFTSDFTSLVIS